MQEAVLLLLGPAERVFSVKPKPTVLAGKPDMCGARTMEVSNLSKHEWITGTTMQVVVRSCAVLFRVLRHRKDAARAPDRKPCRRGPPASERKGVKSSFI